MTQPDLTALRTAIDKVDDELIALLNQRCALVKQVGKAKQATQKADAAFIRPGREAEMVRRVVKAVKGGAFPPEAAAQLWRVIISASLSLEAPLTVSAYISHASHDIYHVTREYFGGFIPITKQPSAKRVLGDVLDGKATVGALPPPDDSPDGAWWIRLPEGIRIFACAPFLVQEESPVTTLLIGKVAPESTGNDISLLSIETDGDVSQNRLHAAFEKRNLAVRWLATLSFPSGHRAHLVEIKGFHTAEDADMLAFKQDIGASLLAIASIGAYAAPIATG